MMIDREKVIKGLECCTTMDEQGFPSCEKCPYDVNGTCPDLDALHRDALELIKAQEPRLLTLDEILQLPNDTPIYNENRNGPSGWDVFTRLAKDGTNDIVTGAYWSECLYWEQNAYGNDWRCWTSRPTDAQRKAAAWNDD